MTLESSKVADTCFEVLWPGAVINAASSAQGTSEYAKQVAALAYLRRPRAKRKLACKHGMIPTPKQSLRWGLPPTADAAALTQVLGHVAKQHQQTQWPSFKPGIKNWKLITNRWRQAAAATQGGNKNSYKAPPLDSATKKLQLRLRKGKEQLELWPQSVAWKAEVAEAQLELDAAMPKVVISTSMLADELENLELLIEEQTASGQEKT